MPVETPEQARARALAQVAASQDIALGLVSGAVARGCAVAATLRKLESDTARLPAKLAAQGARVVEGCRAEPARAAFFLSNAMRGLDMRLALAGEGDEAALEAMLQAGIDAFSLRMAVNAYAVALAVVDDADTRAARAFDPAVMRTEGKRYAGARSAGIGVVVIEPGALILPARLDLANHSPTGFEWGFAGSGPAQLALALCADALGDDQRALRIYQTFKFRIVARLPERWVLAADDVRATVAELEARHHAQ